MSLLLCLCRALAIHEHLCLLNSWLLHMNKWCSVDSYRDFFCFASKFLHWKLEYLLLAVLNKTASNKWWPPMICYGFRFCEGYLGLRESYKVLLSRTWECFLKDTFCTSIELLVSIHVTPKFFELLLPKSICLSHNVGLKIFTA